MAFVLLLPYTIVHSNGSMTPTVAPTVDTLPLNPITEQNVILTQPFGNYEPGAYQWVANKQRWIFVVDYQTICSQIFGVADAFLCFPNAGDNFLPIGSSGDAQTTVCRNGVIFTGYEVNSTGIHLDEPAAQDDLYLVMQWSPLRGNSSLTGGGIPDVPLDDTPYVRKNQAWEQLQQELNEGQY